MQRVVHSGLGNVDIAIFEVRNASSSPLTMLMFNHA
jgi:hypothetical protein